MEHDEDIELNTINVAALTPSTCSTVVLVHGRDSSSPEVVSPIVELVSSMATGCLHPQGWVFRPAQWPSFIEKCTGTARCGIVERPSSTTTASNMAVLPCLTLCFEDNIDVYQLDVCFNIKKQGILLRTVPWPLFEFHSETASSKEPCTTAQDIIGRLSTGQPYEDPSCYVVSYLLHWTSSFDGHYLQVLATLRNFSYEFYNIGPWDRWQFEYLQQYSSPDRASCLECTSTGGNTLNMVWKAPCLFSRMLVVVACKQSGGIFYFFTTSDQAEKLNASFAAGKQVIRLGYVELVPWAHSVLHFIKPCSFSLVMHSFGANGRLSPKTEFSSTNIVHLPRDTTQLRPWPPPLDATGYSGIFQYNIAGMLGYPYYQVYTISASALIIEPKIVTACCWLLQLEALMDVSQLCDPIVGKRTHLNCCLHFSVGVWTDRVPFRLLEPFVKDKIACLGAGDLIMLPSDVIGLFLTNPCAIQSMRYILITHYFSTSKLLSRERVLCSFVPAVRCSLDHGSDFTITRAMPSEFPVKNRLLLAFFCLFICGIRLWKPGISQLIVSFGALACRCKRAYFSGSQGGPLYGGLDCDIRLGYCHRMVAFNISTLSSSMREKTPSWRRNGFGPGHCVQQHLERVHSWKPGGSSSSHGVGICSILQSYQFWDYKDDCYEEKAKNWELSFEDLYSSQFYKQGIDKVLQAMFLWSGTIILVHGDSAGLIVICFYKQALLPYDPGGWALRLNQITDISDSRLFIIGLRASRISRGGECNTPTMGCHHVDGYLGLGYVMGHVLRLCGCLGSV